MSTENRDIDGRWIKGQSGNPKSHKRGVSDWRAKYRQSLEDAAPEIIQSIISAAIRGESTAQTKTSSLLAGLCR